MSMQNNLMTFEPFTIVPNIQSFRSLPNLVRDTFSKHLGHILYTTNFRRIKMVWNFQKWKFILFHSILMFRIWYMEPTSNRISYNKETKQSVIHANLQGMAVLTSLGGNVESFLNEELEWNTLPTE